jgi:hypothetical protein
MVLEESCSTNEKKGGHALTILSPVEMGEKDAWGHFVVLVVRVRLFSGGKSR